MRPPYKPGPKSKKNKSLSREKAPSHPAADLGETDTTTDADEDLEEENDESFHSPAEETGRANVSLGLRSRRNESALVEQDKSTSVVDKQNSARVIRSIGNSRKTEPNRLIINRPNRPVARRRKGTQMRNFLKNYKKLAARVDFMIPRAAFSRVVREIMMSLDTDVRYITRTAFEALQAATEAYVEGRLEDANLLALHARRVTLMVRDLELINFLRSNER